MMTLSKWICELLQKRYTKVVSIPLFRGCFRYVSHNSESKKFVSFSDRCGYNQINNSRWPPLSLATRCCFKISSMQIIRLLLFWKFRCLRWIRSNQPKSDKIEEVLEKIEQNRHITNHGIANVHHQTVPNQQKT